MKDLDTRARLIRWGLGVALVSALVVGLTACAWLFNKLPTAAFTVSTTTGQAPLTVNFSAVLSSDPDGTITDWEWDFGDGANGTGETVSHTYTTAGTRIVVLRVTDNDGAQDTAQKTINVLPGEATGPSARFTASPTSGTSPLVVQFNATGTTYDLSPLTYSWTFGDGVTGTGVTTSHLYVTSTTRTYTVTLTVRGPDGREGTATGTITVVGGGGGGSSSGTTPSPYFTAVPEDGIAPLRVAFDPHDSEAASGRTLVTYTWSFGDLAALTTNNPQTVGHTYTTARPTELFTATLVVIDDEGAVGTTNRSIEVDNRQPVAGFQLSSDGVTWVSDDLTIHTAGVQSGSVHAQSAAPTGLYWGGAGTLPNSGSTTPTGYSADDDNFSYDPEGQSVLQGWGIVMYAWNWGDGSGITYVPTVNGGCPDTWTLVPPTGPQHTYDLGGLQQQTWTIQVEVYDALGARATFTRQVTVSKI